MTLPGGTRSLVASLLPPAGCVFAEPGSVQLSPDGDVLAFIAICGENRAIWLRSLERGESRRIEGTAGASYPFWDPDGQSLGFFATGRLRRVDLGSAAIRDLAPAPNGRGGSWNRAGTILYAPDIFGPIYRIPANGGQPSPVTRIAGRGTVTHRIPYFLPDGTHFLFSEQPSSSDSAGRLLTGSIGSWDTRPLLDRGTNVAYANGFLFFGREGVLLAQPFDPAGVTLSGSPLAVASELRTYSPRLQTAFSAAGGRLVYEEATTLDTRLDYFDPASGARSSVLDRAPYASLELSPDGRRLLIGKRSRAALEDVWLYEPASGAWSQLSQEPTVGLPFRWLPDGRRFAVHLTDHSVEIRSLDRGEKRTFEVPIGTYLMDWTQDGGFAVGNRQSEATGFDLIIWTRSGDSSTTSPLYATPANEQWPRLSPDGHLLAYVSDQSGRPEVYLTTLPGVARQVQISFEGTDEGTDISAAHGPIAWSRDGRTLYWLGSGGTLQSVSIGTRPELRIGKPVPVPAAPKNIVGLAAAPDGRLLLLYDDRSEVAPLTMVENWSERTRGP
jgi:Tol biopolymer transport system component